eukprot:11626210-Alexandrium_andersonii.AAC.1
MRDERAHPRLRSHKWSPPTPRPTRRAGAHTSAEAGPCAGARGKADTSGSHECRGRASHWCPRQRRRHVGRHKCQG